MIILDTNVLSEPMRAFPDERMLDWLETQKEPLALTTISVGELLTGVRLLPAGRRRESLNQAIESVIAAHPDSILAYDESAARSYARLMEINQAQGRQMSVEDGMIAAICISHGATLATRNVKDFKHLDIPLIDPWTAN